MRTWRENMPDRMFLKSVPFASSLSAPGAACTLADYCVEVGRAPLGEWEPVPIELFIRYGLWFQTRFVPIVEEVRVNRVAASNGGFELSLESGE
jgi:hypothetical protein